MRQFRLSSSVGVACLLTAPVWAQWESGSDGSDGAFAPGASVEVDLGLAASLCDCDADTQVDDECRWDCPSPIAGRGVYDAEQWVIVYKYSTIDVPAGVTVTFKNHPSNPPVVWLATGNVTISGIVDLSGENGSAFNGVVPRFSKPGPGGFAGGQSGHPNSIDDLSPGFGPGGGISYNSGDSLAGPGVHLTTPPHQPGNGGCTPIGGALYGNSSLNPLIGGSGGAVAPFSNADSAGAGGGAILVASDTQINLGVAALINANGGGGGGWSGKGSGGSIRLRSDAITLPSGSQLLASSSAGGVCGATSGGVRLEAFSLTNNATTSGVVSVTNTPFAIFNLVVPQLRIVAMCGEFAPLDPVAGIMSSEVEFDNGSPCTIDIEAEEVPAGTTVSVRVIPARGPVVTATSTPLTDIGGGLRTATATVTFPPGRSEVQLRANW